MTASNVLDWVVALLVCWASLTAVVQPPRETTRCDAPYATSSALLIPLSPPTQAEVDEMIRDMMLHD
ncbi:hypothetical protein MTX26_05345 [Bradyrhizobium sp. ISRA443]|uniref:hypothetical protein n=1 Tax=unclassified Bradyrhizobium TaxID=2631580 RepID=UPI002479CA95|nr:MULTISPECIES: hypothetical protein [unclassified Bradyrhizobium]WGR95308.1 hypothetical protein MTX20_15515 [Bradyrhizobium sp. ISRA435]WGS00279.1 hypothetical protein MTX23_05345 [Bradyrhizobium sp. ISRA436]WGS07168.1 hypothetical protein MTX18_05345 [Bradyrhizobium sp. ISRA437]WGS14053.1 hypothetical protein MTX26_05345 [Bradyrhizobium sp. ISRA443]